MRMLTIKDITPINVFYHFILKNRYRNFQHRFCLKHDKEYIHELINLKQFLSDETRHK